MNSNILFKILCITLEKQFRFACYLTNKPGKKTIWTLPVYSTLIMIDTDSRLTCVLARTKL